MVTSFMDAPYLNFVPLLSNCAQYSIFCVFLLAGTYDLLGYGWVPSGGCNDGISQKKSSSKRIWFHFRQVHVHLSKYILILSYFYSEFIQIFYLEKLYSQEVYFIIVLWADFLERSMRFDSQCIVIDRLSFLFCCISSQKIPKVGHFSVTFKISR